MMPNSNGTRNNIIQPTYLNATYLENQIKHTEHNAESDYGDSCFPPCWQCQISAIPPILIICNPHNVQYYTQYIDATHNLNVLWIKTISDYNQQEQHTQY